MSFFNSLAWIAISFLLFTAAVALISSWKTRGDNLETAEGYFLAGRGLPGVVIAGSLLLTNLSAEQLVGLNGQSWASNMGPIAWEVGSMLTLLALAYYFLPRFLKMGAMTIPSLMEERYGKGTKTNVEANKNGAFSVRVFIDNEESVTFSLRAKADDLEENTIDLTLTRVFTEREGIALFRQKMRSVEFEDLRKDPVKFKDVQFVFRGKVMEFNDYDGTPCALVCVDNVATGVWHGPVWVILEPDTELKVGQLATIYMTGEGQTLPAAAEYTGQGEIEAPVTRAKFVTEITDPS